LTSDLARLEGLEKRVEAEISTAVVAALSEVAA